MFLPIYSVCLVLPMIIGFTALLVLKHGTNSNAALLDLVGQALPGWAVGVVVVATAATAMVPAAGLIVGMSLAARPQHGARPAATGRSSRSTRSRSSR